MSKIDEVVQINTELRKRIGMSKEELFELQVEFGCKFLEQRFGTLAMEIATRTNFWDLFTFEWYKDDVWIFTQINLESKKHYESLKQPFVNSKFLADQIFHLIKAERNHEDRN